MNRNRSSFAQDTAPASDGDGTFLGVNTRLDAAQLPAGFGSEGINVRFERGRAATRKGVRILPWGAQAYQGQGPAVVLPYGSVLLAETYNDPFTATEWLIIVTQNGVYRTKPGATGIPIAIPAGESVASATDLIQTFNGMVMLRGPDAEPLYLRDLSEGWLVLPDAGEGLEQIPAASQGLYFQNRLFVIDGRTDSQHVDSVWVSNFGATTSVLEGDSVYQSFRINQGSSDRLVGLAKFNETTLVAAKSRSIYVVSNIWGDNAAMAANAVLDEVTREYGCIAPRSFVQVGKDLWFLAHRRGVVSLKQTETNALQGVDVPVSRDIESIIHRINWEHAASAVAAAWDNKVYFAVPLDDSTVNNAVLVFSTVTQTWAGYDQSTTIKVRDWIQFSYGGAIRLGYLSVDGFVCLYEDGYHDHVGDTEGNITYQPIQTTFVTRAYLGAVAGNKRFGRSTCRVASWDAAYAVKVLPDGFNEERTVASVDTDNTRYIRPYGKPDWDPSNTAGDWEQPWREDYSAHPADTQVTDSDGDGTIGWGVLQEVEQVWNLPRANAHNCRLKFTSSRGRIEVAGVKVEAIQGSTVSKAHA